MPRKYVPQTGKAVYLDLQGEDGNAFVILGTVGRIIRKELGRTVEEEYKRRARSGDYQHLLDVSNEYVEIREFANHAVVDA